MLDVSLLQNSNINEFIYHSRKGESMTMQRNGVGIVSSRGMLFISGE